MVMRLLRPWALPALCLALNATTGWAQAPAQATVGTVAPLVPETVVAADSLFFAMDPLSAFRRLEVRVEVAPDDYEARWRAARAALVLGVMADAGELKAGWLRVGAYHAEEALALRPNDVEAMAWLAAVNGRLAIDVVGVRDQVRLGLEVWELTERILAIEPNHPLGNDVLGKLNQEVRKLSGFERFIARTFMRGGDPMKLSSWDNAEEYLRRAIAADATVVLFYLDLGDTYRLQGKLDAAKSTYEAGLALPDLYPPDAKFKREIQRQLEQLSR